MDDWLKPGEAWSDITHDADQALIEREVDDAYRQYVMDLRKVARTPEGSRVLCSLLEALGAFDPCWTDKNARLARAVVLRDFGQSLLDDLALAADDVHDDISRMMRIRRKMTELTDNHKKGA